MPQFINRNNCSKEPAKTVPTQTEVMVCRIPRNFPRICRRMIGQIYSAIVHTDSEGDVWYNIPKEQLAFNPVRKDPNNEVSFENRKHIKLPARYCH